MPVKKEPKRKYGDWTVLYEVQSATRHRRVLCRCRCGVERVVLLQNLNLGITKSCGCRHAGAAAMVATRLQKHSRERREDELSTIRNSNPSRQEDTEVR